MDKIRKNKLEKNFGRMFWIQAFSNLKVINVIGTLFFLYRGLSLSQLFYISAIWGIVSVLSEIPSSYLADRWGRKKTMIAGVLFSLVHWILLIFAHNFTVFLIAFIFASIQYSFFSGTDDALVYDTNRELGNSDGGLKRLGKLYSAKSVFKIIAPLIGAFIAKDLLEWQFLVIIGIDIVATISAFVFALLLTEPNHYMDLEEMEAGVMKDAWKLIKFDPLIFRAMISRALVFLSMFVVWRFHQKFFVDIKLPIIWLGISWSIIHAINFFYNQNIEKFIDKNLLQKKINLLNLLVFFTITLFVIGLYILFNKYVFLFLYSVTVLVEMSRWPLYAEFYNRKSKSFNRSTTLSLANFVKGFLDPIILLVAAVLVAKDINYVFIWSLCLALIPVLFFRLSKDLQNKNG